MMVHTETTEFYGRTSAEALVAKYGSPLYVYNERILRERCRDMKYLLPEGPGKVNYSIKANSNLELLRIIHSEGIVADAISPGEIFILQQAGYSADEILYIGNNVSDEELFFAVKAGVDVSVDSLAQLERYGRLHPGGRVAVRFNPGVGAGHHVKVVTGGDKTKFGVNVADIPEVKAILERHGLKLVGINQHIGSHFMDSCAYLAGVKALLGIAEHFKGLEFVDFGGGFGIPYHKQDGEQRLDLTAFKAGLQEIVGEWRRCGNEQVEVRIEPGRYIPAECGVLLGTVHAVKENAGITYIGTDLGFNVLMRPVLYDSYHDVEVYRDGQRVSSDRKQKVTIVGNICETGDIIAKDRELPEICENDVIGIMDAGAYGFAMSSNYNNRLRPAEVLITENGEDVLIRRRETLEDLMKGYEIRREAVGTRY